MPLQYSGVIAEHTAVRTSVGVFDVSHLGKLVVAGSSAGDALQRALTADALALPVGRATYSLVLDDDGGCIDDVFLYRLAEGEWLVVPNAANVDAVADAIRRAGGDPRDEWDRWAILAVQGPDSLSLFERARPGSEVLSLRVHSFTQIDVFGEPALVARTGYTGERGVEVYAPSAVAERLFETLVAEGAVPAGLGARDTLRLEMGYALYGHEIDLATNPLEAGLGWVLAWDTPFHGRDAVEKVRADGPRRRLVGITCTGRGVPRQGHAVLAAGRTLGSVTSGNYSPTLQTGIALAYVPADLMPAIGERVEIEARGRRIEGDIVKPPFIPRPQSKS